VYDSTGSQATVSPGVDLVAAAHACGYPIAVRASDLEALRDALERTTSALTFVHVRTAPRADRKLPRPDLTPPQVVRRLQDWMETG
jgi:phosphonopyruvate decarboxylase